jgi:signal transduction histidine kinase
VLESDPPSFARQVIRHYRESAPERSSLLMGTASDGSIDQLINYLGPARTVKTVSYYQAIDYEHLLPPGIFSGKIVLVGRSLEASPTPAPLSGDLFLTPFSWISGEPLAGIEIQAILIDNILEKRFIRELNKTSQWILLLVLTLASSLLIIKLQLIRALIVVSGLATLSIIISYWVFAKMGLWVPLFSAILSLVLVYGGHLLVRALRVEHERRRLLEAMNRSLETKVAERTKELSFAHQELSQQHQQLELAYRKLAQTQQQLVHSEKMASLGLLVAGVAHELNNPISYVNSNLDFIEDYTERLVQETGMLDGAINLTGNQFQKTLKTLRELIASCKGGTERVRKVVMDLQIFSRADDIDLVLADLHQGLESTLNLLARQYSDRITIHRDYGHLPLVECYPGQINQVFMNLLQNAVQAIPDSGDIWIKTSFDNGWVNIIIKDNGIGIPEKNLNQIFDPFFTTKELGSGTGLGLSISYGIIRKHGGQIYITSVVHEGAEFTIQLPMRH